jgi:hypothetical protein
MAPRGRTSLILSFLTAVLLGSCSGSPSIPTNARPSTVMRADAGGWIDPFLATKIATGSASLVYASTGDSLVDIWQDGDTPPKGPSGQITGLGGPKGLAVDTSGNLYVAENSANDVKVFPPGSTRPSRILTGTYYPNAVAVSLNGTVYVANSRSGAILVYKNGATTPTGILHDPSVVGSTFYVAVDKSSNIFFTFCCYGGGGAVGEYAAHTRAFSQFSSGVNLFGRGIAIDKNGNMLVVAPTNETVLVFPPGQTVAQSTISLITAASTLALLYNDSAFYTADTSSGLTKYQYPSGRPRFLIQDNSSHKGIATFPISIPGTW